jgi:hypothetical protein
MLFEQIRLQNIEENLHSAMENLPESFARVTMLYVPIFLNNHPVSVPVVVFTSCFAESLLLCSFVDLILRGVYSRRCR